MYRDNKILVIIPARSGSKGLPRKNLEPLNGKPLIAWTIDEAKNSKYIDMIIVSTDDEEIADISKKFGASVPFLRPKELATDNARMIDVIFNAQDWIEHNLGIYDLLMLLQPTSPLRLSKDIDSAVELLFAKNAKAIVSVCEVDHHPYWVNTLAKNGCMKDFIRSEVNNKSRQELPQFYRINGAIYLAYSDYIKKQNSFFGKDTFAYIMPRERSIDIDSEIDFIFSEFLLKIASHNVKEF